MSRRGRRPGRQLTLGLAGVLGVGAALLVGCGTKSKLIPAQNASQLTTDFDLVASAVAAGNCGPTLTTALDQTRTDLAALPPTIDPRLASAIQAGAAKLTARATVECAQQTTTTSTTPTNTTPTTTNTTPTNTSPTTTNTTPTNTTPTTTNTTPTTTPTTTTPTDTTPTTTGPVPDNGGGTPAPGAGSTGAASGGTSGGTSGASGGTPGGGGA